MRRLLSTLLLLTIIISSCKTGGKNSDNKLTVEWPDWPRRSGPNDSTVVPRIFAIGTNRDSSRFADYFFVLINDGVGFDSVKHNKFVTTDTQWWMPIYVLDTVRDAQTKRPKIDSLGKPILQTVTRAAPISKDSVRWKDIFGKTYEQLFKKTAPTH